MDCSCSIECNEKLFSNEIHLHLLQLFEVFIKSLDEQNEMIIRMMRNILIIFRNWANQGFYNPTKSGENYFSTKLDKIKFQEKLVKFFGVLESKNTFSDSLGECLDFLCVCLCLLFRRKKPPSVYGIILDRCKYIMNQVEDKSDLGMMCIDASTAWSEIIEAEEVLAKFSKAQGCCSIDYFFFFIHYF
jgi:hypothetical protein